MAVRAPQNPRVGEELEPVPPTPPAALGDGLRLHDRDVAELAAPGISARGWDLRASRLTGCDLSGARLAFAMVQDCELVRCDLAGLVAQDGGLRRVRFVDCRLTGMGWPEADLEDVTFRGCRFDLAGLRFTRLQRVHFDGCVLREADFQGAALGSVRFDGCELRSATFAGARCAATELHGCELDGIEGVAGLRGAALPWPELVGLTGLMAEALGIRVLDDEDR